MRRIQDTRAALRPAPDVTITRLPFGGAVLVNGRTLALLECAEPEAELLAALMTAPERPHGRADELAAALRLAATRLIQEGWLVRAANEGGAR